ncbi:hypothetical protein EXE53_19085 [Halorubrum sp. SD626R]|uniref:DUF7284 family protein n=1 Tax=Halorubrum TaxID=56688 RepID=UPI0010F433B1|nr:MULTISPECIES: hypothetical protein [Halorubrum]TKX78838.1 hypothetical protein EXE53_19085 [Halorubrum sp. SD626R]
MTSTVLDVTVMLLCVSASVVALSSGGLPNGAGTPTASESADRLATETVTVTYAAPEAPGETRTVHATRAEFLALLVAGQAASTDDDASADDGVPTDQNRPVDTFEKRALAAVQTGLDDRTRIDARVRATRPADRSSEPGETNGTTPAEADGTPTAVTVGRPPPRSADTTVAVITHPVPDVAAAPDDHVRIVVRRW